jgi:hypothetical protein
MNFTIEQITYSIYLYSLAKDLLYYCILISLCIGLIGNTISIKVYLSKPFHKQSIGIYFAISSFFELLFLCVNFIYVVYERFWEFSAFSCKLFTYLQSLMPVSCSWILVLISLDRVITNLFSRKHLSSLI